MPGFGHAFFFCEVCVRLCRQIGENRYKSAAASYVGDQQEVDNSRREIWRTLMRCKQFHLDFKLSSQVNIRSSIIMALEGQLFHRDLYTKSNPYI